MLKDAVVTILWVVAIWRLPAARGSAIKRSLWLAIASLALALTVDLPPIAVRIDHWTGLNALSTLLKHLIGILSCTAVLDWVLALTQPKRPGALLRHRYRIAVATAAGLAVMFFLIPRRETDYEFTYLGSVDAAATIYLMIFEIYLGIAMATVCRMCWAAAARARRGFLKSGLVLLTAGTLLGVGYAIARSVLMTVELIEHRTPAIAAQTTAWTDRLQALAIVLILLGTAVPTAEAGWRTVRGYRTLFALRPLWSRLTEAAPGVVLGEAPTARGDLMSLRDLDMRVSRRVIEIRDARLLLREYASDGVVVEARLRLTAAGLTGEDLEAAVEACWLRIALLAKSRGHKYENRLSSTGYGGADLPSEIAWLLRVTESLELPAVTAAAAELDTPRTTATTESAP